MTSPHEFDFAGTTDGFRLAFPSSWYPDRSLEAALGSSEIRSACAFATDPAGRATLTLHSPGHEWIEPVRAVFAGVNGVPYRPASAANEHVQNARPLVSCIILLTANDLFACRTLIPSIVACSRGVPLEIIVVYNGHGADLELFRRFRVVRSPFGWVSKGYNKGVAKARGEYVAIFHDDCLLNDVGWVSRAIERLGAGADAVTPELQVAPAIDLLIAKNVPLVMKRRTFERAGGYDTGYYAGLEDMDFTYALLARGRRVETLDVDYRHFDGMSTTLMLHPRARALKELYGLNMVPKPVVGQIKELLFRQSASEIQAVTAANLQRFCRKHGAYLASIGEERVLERSRALLGVAAPRRWGRASATRRKLMRVYRERMTW